LTTPFAGISKKVKEILDCIPIPVGLEQAAANQLDDTQPVFVPPQITL
jgi:hypothetical protein